MAFDIAAVTVVADVGGLRWTVRMNYKPDFEDGLEPASATVVGCVDENGVSLEEDQWKRNIRDPRNHASFRAQCEITLRRGIEGLWKGFEWKDEEEAGDGES